LTDISKIEKDLRTLFRELHGDLDVDVRDVREINAGWEANIIGFHLIAGGDETAMAARVFNGKSAGLKADREFKLMNGLLRRGYPVPEVYICYTESDIVGAPFIVMEWLVGGSLIDDFLEKPKLWENKITLFSELYVGLHTLPPRKILPFQRSYRTTLSRLRYKISDLSKESASLGIDEFDQVVSWLTMRIEKVSDHHLTIIHQDFHPGNILFRLDGSPVVIDWSGADLGDPREDLAWTKLLASTFYSPELGDAFVAGYTRVSGCKFEDLDYFEVLESLRRLMDAAKAFTSGAASTGMREEAVKIMRQNRPHYMNVLARLTDLTQLETREIAKLIS
jgi:aminoglycoside phosphotransferase (APT) family kinase protein